MDLNKSTYYDHNEIAAKKAMVGVYGWMTLALLITAVAALMAITSPQLMSMYPVFAIAEVAIVFFLSFRIHKMSAGSATIAFVAYSILNGLTMGGVLAYYGIASVFQAFIVTAGLFAIMSIYGMVTKTDLSSIGNLFVMGLVGVIFATLVNMFLRSTGLDLVLTYISVFLFIGLVGYDTQKIKQFTYMQGEYGVASRNVSILGALTLYLDFVNLFLNLIRLFGRSDD